MTTVERLRTEFMNLPQAERASLARELLGSFEEGSGGDTMSIDLEIAAAWGEETVRRSRAFDAGETTARDWRETVAEIQQKLDERISQLNHSETRP